MEKHVIALLTALLIATADAAVEPQAWIVQFLSPAGVMDLHVLVAEGKAVAGFGARSALGGAQLYGRIPSRDMGIAAEALATVPKLLAEPKASDKKAK